MAVERIHLVLEPHLMRAFREMADKNHRSVSGQFACILEAELDRQRQRNLEQIEMVRQRVAAETAEGYPV